MTAVINKAERHGWRALGVIFLGNVVYTEMRRLGGQGKSIAVCPVTGRAWCTGR